MLEQRLSSPGADRHGQKILGVELDPCEAIIDVYAENEDLLRCWLQRHCPSTRRSIELRPGLAVSVCTEAV